MNVTITKKEEYLIFIGFILVFAQDAIKIAIGILKAYFFMKQMEFEDVFWIVQLGTFT